MSNDYVNVPKARPYNYLILRHLPGKGILLPFVEAGWGFLGPYLLGFPNITSSLPSSGSVSPWLPSSGCDGSVVR